MIHYDPTGLQASDYEHPADRIALAAVKKIPLLDKLFASYLNYYSKSGDYQITTLNDFRVTAQTYPRLYTLYQTALDRLNMDVEPKLFIRNAYDYNGYTFGVKEEPYIVLNSFAVGEPSDEEFLYLVGHELGHVKSGHVLYSNLIRMLYSFITNNTPIPPIITGGASLSLLSWSRKSELTADRAGIIAAGGVKGAEQFMMRFMGKSAANRYVDFSTDKITQQIESFDDMQEQLTNKAVYWMLISMQTHPLAIERIREAQAWAQTPEYKQLLDVNK